MTRHVKSASCTPSPHLLFLALAPKHFAALQRQREPHCVVFDAILVKRSEREPVLLQAHAFAVPAVAVWFRTPLQVCIARNAARAADEIADERGLRNVFAAVEPPLAEEGFAQVLQMDMPGS